MYLFVDTEFTDFKDCDLISLGIVSEDGQHEFYIEITDHKVEWQSQFVKDVVLPLLKPAEYGMLYDEAARKLAEWINQLPTSHVSFIFDYGMDYQLLKELLMNVQVDKQMYAQNFEKGFLHACHERGIHNNDDLRNGFRAMVFYTEEYFVSVDRRRHHALVDAKSNRNGWVKGMEAARGRE